MKRLLSLLVLPVIMLGMSACTQQSALDKPPGEYSSSTSTTNPNGTDVSRKNTESVGYDANGKKKAVVKSTTTVDPPGLFNKSSTTSTDVESQ